MKISQMAVYGLCLSATLLWLPSGSGAAPNCQEIGNDLWTQWGKGGVPKNNASIKKLLKFKQDCPQLSGSIDRMVNDIKAQRGKIGGADADLTDVGKEL